MPTTNEIIRDKMIGHQIGLQRLSGGLSQKLLNLLTRTEDDLIWKLRGIENKRLASVLADIRLVSKAAAGKSYEVLSKELTGLAGYEVDYNRRMLQGAIPVNFNMTMP